MPIMRPGTTPAMNSPAIETLPIAPYTTAVMLSGTSAAIVEAAAMSWRALRSRPSKGASGARGISRMPCAAMRVLHAGHDSFRGALRLVRRGSRRLDRLHLEYPFAGSRMLRGLLAAEGCKIGRRHVKTLMRRMG